MEGVQEDSTLEGPGSSAQDFCLALWWLAFMQLIRSKWLEKKPVLRPAAIFGLCDERNTSLATVPVLPPPQLEDGGRQGQAEPLLFSHPPPEPAGPTDSL